MKKLIASPRKLNLISDKKAQDLVKYSISQYKDTYHWLADYDQGTTETAQILANTPLLREALQKLPRRVSL